MDIKNDGINKEIFQQALAQAKRGREHIMGHHDGLHLRTA